jgi:putative endonuclease
MTGRIYFVYIMTNQHDQVLYTGVTNDLYRRTKQHKSGKGGKFTSHYHLTKLVYYEIFDYVDDAIAREKQIKGGSRQNKIDLVNGMNPDWDDLIEKIEI